MTGKVSQQQGKSIINSFAIKGELYVNGVKIEKSALKGVGSLYKEHVGLYHFNPNFCKSPFQIPAEITLSHNFSVPVILNRKSPLIIKRKGKQLLLFVNDKIIAKIAFSKRPPFYSKLTKEGIPMWQLVQHRLDNELMFVLTNWCGFAKKRLCLFCGLSANTKPLYENGKLFLQTPDQITEITTTSYKEKSCQKITLTAGYAPHDLVTDYCVEVGKKLQHALQTSVISGSHLTITPPENQKKLKQLKSAGWETINMNLEVWNPKLFAFHCSGKQAVFGRSKWIRALEKAAEIFGPFKVGCSFVSGLEPMESYLEGAEYLASKKILPSPIPWQPMPGSALEGCRSPEMEWHVKVAARTLDILEKNGLYLNPTGWLTFEDLARLRHDLRRRRVSMNNPVSRLAFAGEVLHSPLSS